MNRLDLLRSLALNAGKHGGDMYQEVSKFVAENAKLSDKEFFGKFKDEYPWLDLAMQDNRAHNMRVMTNMMVFFTIVAVLALISSIVIAIS